MAANTKPIFVLTPNVGIARVAAANTAADGSGALVTLFTPGLSGSLVFRIRYGNSQAAAAASSPMVARVFVDSGTPRLVTEWAIPAATRSTTVVGIGGIITFNGNGLFLLSGQLLKVIQSVYVGVADQMDYVAEGGDY